MRPRLLDLFCGAGGAAMGYHRAGFEVVGVDIRDQPHYPFTFIRADALEVLDSRWFNRRSFDFIHASPPCQHYSDLAGRNGNADEHPDLIGATREALGRIPQKYVIENVEGAPLNAPTTLCGTAFLLGVDGYRLRRHRLFETNWPLAYMPLCACAEDERPIIDVSGGGPTHAPRRDGGGGRTYKGTVAQKKSAMGIDWMNGSEIVEAIPPDYTEAIGRKFLAYAPVARHREAGVREALEEVVREFNMWSEDANDGTFAYYRSDGLMTACVNAREALGRERRGE